MLMRYVLLSHIGDELAMPQHTTDCHIFHCLLLSPSERAKYPIPYVV